MVSLPHLDESPSGSAFREPTGLRSIGKFSLLKMIRPKTASETLLFLPHPSKVQTQIDAMIAKAGHFCLNCRIRRPNCRQFAEAGSL
jgi:hypothetical protein